MISGYDIVCLSLLSWDDHWGTSQQLMGRLAGPNRVLYVDPPVSLMSFATGVRSRSFVLQRLQQWRRGRRKVATGVYVATPPPLLPFRYRRTTSRLNAAVLRGWLAGQLREMCFTKPIIWNFQPSLSRANSNLDATLRVYHCVDDFAALPQWWNGAGDVHSRDAECSLESDAIVCTGRLLAEERSRLNANVCYVPNGANVELFAQSAWPETQVAPEISALPGPVLGYTGVVDFRVDLRLVAAIARRQPNWHFAFIGLVKGGADLAAVRGLPNVHFFDWQPPEKLPSYIKGMDVCLMPYIKGEWIRHAFPLKLFEYLAAGKPVVSTDMEEVRPYSEELVSLTRSEDEFHAEICRALADTSPAQGCRRQEVARLYSWDNCVERISDFLQPLLDARYPALAIPEPAAV